MGKIPWSVDSETDVSEYDEGAELDFVIATFPPPTIFTVNFVFDILHALSAQDNPRHIMRILYIVLCFIFLFLAKLSFFIIDLIILLS